MEVIKIKLPNIKFFFLLMPLLLTEANALESLVTDAAENGDIALVKQLLKEGVEVNEPQGDGMTALHWAAERGNSELAEILIYAGANPMAGTRIGQYRPMHLAAKKGKAASGNGRQRAPGRPGSNRRRFVRQSDEGSRRVAARQPSRNHQDCRWPGAGDTFHFEARPLDRRLLLLRSGDCDEGGAAGRRPQGGGWLA